MPQQEPIRVMVERKRSGGGLAALAALAGAVALATAGCSGSGKPAATSNAATVSGKRAGQLNQAYVACGNSQFTSNATTPSARCASVTSAESAVSVVACGAGLTTDSACVFARNVKRGYATALEGALGKSPGAFLVPDSGRPPNQVACTGSPSRWRCRSERNRAVWVAYRKP